MLHFSILTLSGSINTISKPFFINECYTSHEKKVVALPHETNSMQHQNQFFN
jgi:hypothetical protein